MTKQWARHKDTIRSLYMVQGKSLEDTMKIMKAQHGFDPSTRAYRAQFKKWEWAKYNKQQRSANRPRTRLPVVGSATVAQPHEATLMTPGPSSQSDSSLSGIATTRAIHSPTSSYALYSPDMGHSSITRDPHQGGGLSTTVYSHYGVDQQSHVQPIQPFGGSRFQGPSSPQRNGGAFHVPQAYFQQQQQSSPYRHILPAQPQHHGHHRNLRIETGTTNPTAFDNASFLSPILSVSSPMQPFEQVNSIMSNIRRLQVAGRLNERFLAVNGHYLTKFEQYIQNFVLWRSRGAPLSPEDVYEFCRICAGYVQHDADVGRVVPPNLEQTLRKALGSADRVAVIEAAVQYHQRQLQREQQDGGLVIPPWVSVWISACQQCLSGSLSVLDEHLDALRCLPNAPLDIHELRTCLPRQITPAPYGTPESSSNQLPNQNVWDQQQ